MRFNLYTVARPPVASITSRRFTSEAIVYCWELSELYVIDIEDVFHATLKRPITVSESKGGTPSYRFRDEFTSWHPAADRFAGAILICELLTLDLPDCQEQSAEESYFTQDHRSTVRYFHVTRYSVRFCSH